MTGEAVTSWRPSDLEAIRSALGIPVTVAAIGAIVRAMAELERWEAWSGSPRSTSNWPAPQ